jgi:hypothetical protein
MSAELAPHPEAQPKVTASQCCFLSGAVFFAAQSKEAGRLSSESYTRQEICLSKVQF